MHWIRHSYYNKQIKEHGSAIFLAPMLILMVVYLMGFLLDLGDALTKASDLDQSVEMAAASATTQVSKSSFYETGSIKLNSSDAYLVASSELQNSLPAETQLIKPVTVVTTGPADCVRGTVSIRLPFTLIPGSSDRVTYSTSSAAIAKGVSTSTVPSC